ncbi:hypothetical protein K4F52_008431 [Lecanicillium sp. MT-2017a]|nr:hypothetical protein K4F52_008431 [Lecanicillium sp. MT-2017a]
MPKDEDNTRGTISRTNPRRVSPANSVTLRHHRLARDASLRASPGSRQPNPSENGSAPESPRRNSSGDSYETGQSDPKKWFDRSNQNPTATFDTNAMDVDPPFFQKESESSTEDQPNYQSLAIPPRLREDEASSSAEDYRSVIDDLTVEIQKLKDELKHYKQHGPEMLKKEKLFEIKVHGLPKRKRRELEATLREFTAGLEGSPDTSSSRRKKSSKREDVSGAGSMSKQASSSSGSNTRPVDSAYASMSTGANSSGASLGRKSNRMGAKASEQKVESYLRDIPEGLYPRHVAMTDKDRKKVVVRRLEQLFTGKINGRYKKQQQLPPRSANANDLTVGSAVVSTMPDQNQNHLTVHKPPTLTSAALEPGREARILPPDVSGKKSRSRDNHSTSNSNSNGDQTESGGNGNSSGSGNNTSPTDPTLAEQRPTRPKDLDPDRIQVPSDNMEYIRHLGLVPPELLPESSDDTPDVAPDAEGWVYLNLLCNLAQLHMINVTPSFVRSAISEISTKFQLSADGRKIRWRGGTEGTKLSSDSSGDNSPNSAETGETKDSGQGKRKRQKTGHSTGDSGISSKELSKYGVQASASSESFHYKPLFARPESPNGGTSMDETLSSFGPVEESNQGESRYGVSGSGSSNRKKRRRGGAIIYYSGAPFCTDLSGDGGDVSPPTYMMSSGQEDTEDGAQYAERPTAHRSASGSSLSYKPLSSETPWTSVESDKMDIDDEQVPGLASDNDEATSESEVEFPWSDDQQYLEVVPLEPCGLGGVLPDDHFMVVVTTKRPKKDSAWQRPAVDGAKRTELTDGIISRLATMSTSSPAPATTMSQQSSRSSTPGVEIEYTSGRIKRLAPVPLPPPVVFFPPFSSDNSFENEFDSEYDSFELPSEEQMSQRVLHQSDGYPDGVDLSSGDEDGEDPDDESPAERMYEHMDAAAADEAKAGKAKNVPPYRRSVASSVAATARGRTKSASAEPPARTGGSSAATAGGVRSRYSRSDGSESDVSS